MIRYRFASSGDYRLAIRGTFGVLNISFPTGHPAYVYQLKVTSNAPSLQTVRPFHVVSGATSRVRMSGEKSALFVDSLIFSDPGMSAIIVERSPDSSPRRSLSPPPPRAQSRCGPSPAHSAPRLSTFWPHPGKTVQKSSPIIRSKRPWNSPSTMR